MRLLVSTKKTQGKRKNDFCWVDEGEIVTFAFECDREEIDGTCGCRRALTGVKSRKATTTFEVAELKITKADLIEILAASYMEAGFAKDIPAAKKAVKEDADELISLANSFPVGTVLEKRGNELKVRVMGKKEVPMKTPAKTQTQPRTKPPEQTKEEFVAYLRETLIPDLKEAGSVETAADFERCLSFMGDKEQVLVPKELLHRRSGEPMSLDPNVDLKWSLWSAERSTWQDKGLEKHLRAMEDAFVGRTKEFTVHTAPRKEIRYGRVTVSRDKAAVEFRCVWDDPRSLLPDELSTDDLATDAAHDWFVNEGLGFFDGDAESPVGACVQKTVEATSFDALLQAIDDCEAELLQQEQDNGKKFDQFVSLLKEK